MTPTSLCAERTESHSCLLPEPHSGSHHWGRASPHNHLSDSLRPVGACPGCDDHRRRVDARAGAVLLSS